MGLHGRNVDQKFGRRSTALRQRLEQARPDAFRSPALKPIVERLARAIRGRRILPPRAGQHDLNDAADHASIIHARLATRIGGQCGTIRANCRSESQKRSASIARLLSETANHRPLTMGIPLWIRALVLKLLQSQAENKVRLKGCLDTLFSAYV